MAPESGGWESRTLPNGGLQITVVFTRRDLEAMSTDQLDDLERLLERVFAPPGDEPMFRRPKMTYDQEPDDAALETAREPGGVLLVALALVCLLAVIVLVMVPPT